MGKIKEGGIPSAEVEHIQLAQACVLAWSKWSKSIILFLILIVTSELPISLITGQSPTDYPPIFFIHF